MHTPRDPYNTNLHAVLRETYRQVFFDKEINGIQLPFHLEREFKKYLNCGILSCGMADFIVLIAIKIRSLHLVAREERFVQVAQDEGLQILPNIYWKKSFQKSQ